MIAKVTDIEAEKAAPEQPASATSKLKDSSLKAAGYGYLVGDAALFVAGIAAKDPKTNKRNYKDATVGLAWGIGGLAAARYGNPKAEQQLRILSYRLGEHLREKGVDIPSSSTTSTLAKEGGIIDKIESFLYTYPSESLNAVYAAFATLLTYSGIKGNNKAKAITGALITAGGLAGLLIHEKKPDPNHPATGIIEKTKEWVQEKPLRVPGTLYGLSNIGLIMTAFKAKKDQPDQKLSYFSLFLTAASYIFANTMLRLSSKDHAGEGDIKESRKALQELANGAAHVIATQKPEVQETLVQDISNYLAKDSMVKMSAPEIAELLHAKLAETQKLLPAAGKWQNLVQKGPEPSLSPSV
jgi:hypothetical protein